MNLVEKSISNFTDRFCALSLLDVKHSMIDEGAEMDLQLTSDDDVKGTATWSVSNGLLQCDDRSVVIFTLNIEIVLVVIEFDGFGECTECSRTVNFADSFCALRSLDDKNPMIDDAAEMDLLLLSDCDVKDPAVASIFNGGMKSDGTPVVIFLLQNDIVIVLVVIWREEFDECTEWRNWVNILDGTRCFDSIDNLRT